MGGTRLKRKARRNKTKASTRKQIMKVQGFKPVIKAIDKEAIIEKFRKIPAKTKATAEVKEIGDIDAQDLTPSKPAKTAGSKSDKPSSDKETTKKSAVSATVEAEEEGTSKSKTDSKTTDSKVKSASKPDAETKTKTVKKATAKSTLE